MTVYFVQKIDDPSRVKIGFSTQKERRISALTASHGALLLVASIKGADAALEARLHERFRRDREEGEWFRVSDPLRAFMDVYAISPPVRFDPSRISWREERATGPRDGDAQVAGRLLSRALASFSGTLTRAETLEQVFLRLANRNITWSRRRVRSLWEGKARRIELFEVIDLLEVAQVPRGEWADFIAPRRKGIETEQASKKIGWADDITPELNNEEEVR